MLDKIVLSSNRKQAMMVFTDREPMIVSSDVDVVPLLMWFLDCPGARLIVANDGETVTGIEIRKFDDEITVKIKLDGAA